MNLVRAGILAVLIQTAIPMDAVADCSCREPLGEPHIPCGYCEGRYEMEYSKIEVSSYLEVVQSYMQCLRGCIDEANIKAEEIIDQWNHAVRQYSLQ